ncbi:hypothetical protein IFM89_020101 [Coptis chinensis]|uniref:RNase H type-1 domain-containing protein n=1 Tax=Coptis chinensis TaxID=261450 RepID=A0A835LM65_9MAGN|nr:hypothetical protein IFM89_020101 [Coptis chinensis]
MKAKAVVARGMVWQIGDGSKINFWNDTWVYFLGVGLQASETLGGGTRHSHSDSQDALLPGGYWNEPLLGSLHMPIRSAITSTIIRANISDKLVWQFTKKGTFSAKSAYHVVVSLKAISTQAFTSSFNPKLYLQIWQLKIPYRVQNFIGKASHNILPTCEVLIKHNLNTVLSIIKKPIDINDMCSPALFYAIMDAIWQARNNKRSEGSKSNQQSILQHAYNKLQDWNRAFTSDAEVIDEHMENDNTSIPLESSWINPPPFWVKLNFDANFHKDCYYANIVVIGRDSRGEFLGRKVSRVKATSLGEAEALAVELEVNYAVQQHWREVIVEGDAKSVILIHSLNMQHVSSQTSKMGKVKGVAVQQHWREVIVEGDAKLVILVCADIISASSWTWNQALCNISMSSSSFNFILFRFTPRTCNMSAHKLAKWARSRESLSVLDVCNNFLNRFLKKE